MMDETAIRGESDEPVGYPVTGHGPGYPGKESPDFVGVEEHGTPEQDGIAPPGLPSLSSAVWGGFAATVTSPHGVGCGYCGVDWPTSVCMPAHTHPGVDIGIVRSTPLYAAEGGRVEFAGWARYYRPHHVDIRTPSGELHIYGHMWSVDPRVVEGGQVQTGQYLGTSGEQTVLGTMTPDTTGAHLHFERRLGNGCAADPTATLAGAANFQFCPPDPPPAFDGTEKRINNVVFQPDQRTVACSFAGLSCRRWASLNACTTRAPLVLGEEVDVLYWLVGENVNGEDRWWVAVEGTRLHVGGTVQKPQGA